MSRVHIDTPKYWYSQISDILFQASEKGSLNASVFNAEEELFAFDRTISRMTEMQTKEYWERWKTHVVNREHHWYFRVLILLKSVDTSKWTVDTMKKKWNEIIIHTVLETELNENAEKIMTKNAKISWN